MEYFLSHSDEIKMLLSFSFYDRMSKYDTLNHGDKYIINNPTWIEEFLDGIVIITEKMIWLKIYILFVFETCCPITAPTALKHCYNSYF